VNTLGALADVVAEDCEITKRLALEVLRSVIANVQYELQSGNEVRIPGFVSLQFRVRAGKKKGTVVRNPFDGTERKLDAAIPPKIIVRPRASTAIRNAAPSPRTAVGKAIMAEKG
jgi:nucleoid DNA-binding protein